MDVLALAHQMVDGQLDAAHSERVLNAIIDTGCPMSVEEIAVEARLSAGEVRRVLRASDRVWSQDDQGVELWMLR